MITQGFPYRLRRALDERDMSAADLARKTGIPEGAISHYKKGTYEPKQRRLDAIAQALNVSVTWLMGYDSPMEPAPSSLSASNLEPMPAMRRLPLLGSIACGSPIVAEENIEAYIAVPEGVHADFVLRCKGDSMINARIHDGDIVFIHQQPEVENGEIAAVLNGDGEATLKRVYYDGDTITLLPANPDYPPRSYSGADLDGVRIIGKAVAFLSEI